MRAILDAVSYFFSLLTGDYDRNVRRMRRHAQRSYATVTMETAKVEAERVAESRAEDAGEPDRAPWTCPRCKTALELETISGLHIHSCASCGGLALERRSQAILQKTTNAWPALHARAIELAERATTKIDTTQLVYLKCARCRSALARRNFERVSGVMIDECPAHGAWFDHRELARALDFLDTGGLDKREKFEANEQRLAKEQKRVMKEIGKRTRYMSDHRHFYRDDD